MTHPLTIGIRWPCRHSWSCTCSCTGCGIQLIARRTCSALNREDTLFIASRSLNSLGNTSRIPRRSPRKPVTQFSAVAGVSKQFPLNSTLLTGIVRADGLARKIHYTCDWFFAMSWGLITGFNSPFPWFYSVFFTVMIIHRARRDIERCRERYGEAWEEYERRVPYLFIPVSSPTRCMKAEADKRLSTYFELIATVAIQK